MQPLSRSSFAQSSFTSHSHPSRTRVVAVADDAYKITLESIHDEVKCPICLGIISNTRTFMECMHRFCAECIEKYIRVRKKECPQCRMHCSSKRSLRPDKRFDSLIDALYPDRQIIELQEKLLFDRPDMLIDARARLEKFTQDVQIQQHKAVSPQAKSFASAVKSTGATDEPVKRKREKSGSKKRAEKLALKLQAKAQKKQEKLLLKKRKRKLRASSDIPLSKTAPAPSEHAPPRKRIKIHVSSASREAHPGSEFASQVGPSVGNQLVKDPAPVHEDDLRQYCMQVELMLYAFDGSPSLDKVSYLCPGSLRVRALRRFIKATLAQSGHVVSKVSIAVELAGVLPGDLTVAAVRDVVCAGHAFFAVVLHYSTL